jgi:hypothetical protein
LTTGKYLNVMRECGHIVQVFVMIMPLGLPVLFKEKKKKKENLLVFHMIVLVHAFDQILIIGTCIRKFEINELWIEPSLS